MNSTIRRASLCMLLSCAGLGLYPAAAARPRPQVRFGARSLTPKTARGGNSVTVTVQVIATGGATISGVNLRFSGLSGAPTGAALSPGPRNRWTGRFTVPANTSSRAVSLSVWADAQTSLGTRSVKVGAVKVQPTPVDPNLPPPPPPI